MSNLKTVDIKGKAYVEVNERIRHFRSDEQYKGYQLLSDIVSIENGVCIIKATILDENCTPVANGLAYEKEGSSFINKTSYIENCETSAWGRALGNLGIGIETSIASSNEVQNAIKQQKEYVPKMTLVQKDKIIKLQQDGKTDLDKVLKYYKVNSLDDLNSKQAETVIKQGEKK